MLTAHVLSYDKSRKNVLVIYWIKKHPGPFLIMCPDGLNCFLSLPPNQSGRPPGEFSSSVQIESHAVIGQKVVFLMSSL